MTQQTIEHVILVDGYGFVFRAYHSLPPLTRGDGTPVGAVLGFTNMLFKLMQEYNNEQIIVVFDAGSKTFRNDIYDHYKANRPPAPEDLIPQFPLVRQAAEAMNIKAIDKEGYEADDIIATYADRAKQEGKKVTIVSSDKDLMQLIDDSDNIAMYDAMKSKVIQAKQVEEKFGVQPNKVLDVLSLMGDSSDNVPGVPGIGPKTASQLVNEYGSLESILANASQIKQQKRRESLINHAEDARLSYRLITLDNQVPDLPSLEEMQNTQLDILKFLEFARENGFKALEARVQKHYGYEGMEQPESITHTPQSNATPIEYQLVETREQLQHVLSQAKQHGIIGIHPIFDKNTTIGIALSCVHDSGVYVPIIESSAPKTEQASLFDTAIATDTATISRNGLSLKELLTELKRVITDRAIIKIAHNIKPFLQLCMEHHIIPTPTEDVMVMSYAIAAGQYAHDLHTMSERYLGVLLPAPESLTGKGKEAKPLDTIDNKEVMQLACTQLTAILQLYSYVKQACFQAKTVAIYETLDRPLVEVLAAMEHAGIKVNPAYLHQLSKEFETRLAALEKIIHQKAGREFNIASPKQLGEVLFDELALSMGDKQPKKSKTGAYSTGADILEQLAALGHDIAENILEWRQLAKLKSTYTDALVKQINDKTGRIHSHFSMVSTSTGRLSSSDPNVQNIPIRTEEGYKIREAFIAKEGHALISADYSQIELRLLAHMADINSLKQAFAEGKDIHATTASEIFGIPIEGMDPLIRRKAKAINFGIIYGISAFGLARQLSIPRSEASAYIQRYFEQYPGIHAYMEHTKEVARAHGYVSTLWGRKCFVPGINDKNGAIRSFAERAAINAPLQGSAADIMRKAMIEVYHLLQQQYPQARLILQVHDELLVELPKEQAEALSISLKHTMEQAASLTVPLIVEVGKGENWREIH